MAGCLDAPHGANVATSSTRRSWRRHGQSPFYRDCGVPDTVDGRFDLIVLHTYIVLDRLRAEGEAGRKLSQQLFDTLFDDMDRSLREMGVGDLSVGKHVKRMASGFYGRMKAYDEARAAGDEALAEALRRNVYGAPGGLEAVAGGDGAGGDVAAGEGTAPVVDAEALAALVAYVRREIDALGRADGAALLDGNVSFGPAPRVGADG